MTNNAPTATWALRLHAGCDWVFWAMTMNFLWLIFTLAGGVIFGAAPATVAASALTRRRLRGDKVASVREFAAEWRREFLRANAVVAPPLLAAALLLAQVALLFTAGSLAEPVGIATAIAACLAFGLAAIVAPLYVNYDLPLRSYLPTAWRWMLGNLAHTMLLLIAATAVISASAFLPGLLPFVSIGAWPSLSPALCIGFFTANDRAVAERDAATSASAASEHTVVRPQLSRVN